MQRAGPGDARGSLRVGGGGTGGSSGNAGTRRGQCGDKEGRSERGGHTPGTERDAPGRGRDAPGTGGDAPGTETRPRGRWMLLQGAPYQLPGALPGFLHLAVGAFAQRFQELVAVLEVVLVVVPLHRLPLHQRPRRFDQPLGQSRTGAGSGPCRPLHRDPGSGSAAARLVPARPG